MSKIGLFQPALTLALAILVIGSTRAAELEEGDTGAWVAPQYQIVLPPERHVIEVVEYGSSTRFIINGAQFAAKTPACFGWLAGERVKFLSGSLDGRCVEAVIYNATRRETCEMWCGGRAFW